MKPYGGFEANAQNLRIFTLLEAKNTNYPGLNLTRAVIDGQMKYKESFRNGKEKFIYREHLRLMRWAGNEAGKAVSIAAAKCKSFECEIMDWADVVAYAVHDLEDSLHAGYINSRTFKQDSSEIEVVIRGVAEKFEISESEASEHYSRLTDYLSNNIPAFKESMTPISEHQRKVNRKESTSLLIQRYIQAAECVERGCVVSNPLSERYRYSVKVPLEYKVEIDLINKIIAKLVIQSPQVSAFEEKGKHIVRSLFNKLMENDNVHRLLPDDWREYLNADDSEGNRARVVADYVSGMTDGYAQKTYARLFLPQHGSIYEVL